MELRTLSYFLAVALMIEPFPRSDCLSYPLHQSEVSAGEARSMSAPILGVRSR